MLMAASDESHENVELLIPPEGSIPGERIWFGSEDDKDKQPDAASPNQVRPLDIRIFNLLYTVTYVTAYNPTAY